MKAQLAHPTKTVKSLLESNNWGIQQKLDGQRMLLSCGEDGVKAFNRQGDSKKCPAAIADYFSQLKSRWLFDGELIGHKYYIFDILEIPTGNVENWELSKRYRMLEKLATKLKDPVHLLPLILDKKEDYLNKCFETKCEGVVFKRLDAPYKQKKTYNFLKYKFVNDVDCVVMSKYFLNKNNLVLGMYDDNGSLVEVGRVSSLTGDGPKVKKGDVVKVTILYSTSDGRLYQPVKPILRDDKKPTECLLTQIKETQTRKDIIHTQEEVVVGISG